jgi:hypothetical protein
VRAGLDPVPVTDIRDLAGRLRALRQWDGPAILLSASVPYVREGTSDMTPQERADQRERSKRYVHLAHPQSIRLAVAELTKAALMRDARLIFGAHPAISPMVLSAARNAGALPESILIFQSDFFAGQIPGSTLQLADWSAGRMFFTPQRSASRYHDARKLSLTEMRSLMVSPSSLRGAVFVGGMEGTVEEAGLFNSAHADLPRYAIASTGSAARDLFDSAPRNFAGSLPDPKLLVSGSSYSLLARKILDDMRIFAPPARGRG